MFAQDHSKRHGIIDDDDVSAALRDTASTAASSSDGDGDMNGAPHATPENPDQAEESQAVISEVGTFTGWLCQLGSVAVEEHLYSGFSL